ncbi:hypothetical protein HT136_01320 [Novosphingobium profundi]|uniref:hypothetical protein n=1 Tax=Novosphingobium profundi TaxID=1774954 RepID=UPI001BDA9F04|nr:hypothetical protein [Novosphingobium profundi]MBT0667006.1 hypothetical protein [Novosphingobium profundi]
MTITETADGLEPILPDDSDASLAMRAELSKARSMKRIADALEQLVDVYSNAIADTAA